MSLGQRLIELRKEKKLSQEEVAGKLNVTRQTVSKWETDQSTPDFDKILPLCELYGISTEELITGKKVVIQEEKQEKTKEEIISDTPEKKSKRVKGLVIGILIYFVAISWIMVSIPVIKMNPIVSSAIFLLICGIATCLIVYTQIMYKKEKKEKEKEKSKLYKQIEDIVAIITTIIYLIISFSTMAWHITWIIWLVYALVMEIVKLIISMKGDQNEE